MSEKSLTDLVRIRGDLAGSTGEDGLQRLGAFAADVDVDVGTDIDKAKDICLGNDISIDEAGHGGWGCRAEDAKGEGGEGGEDERAHCERLMSGEESGLAR